MSTAIKEKYAAFIKRVEGNGTATLGFYCPHCKSAILTLAAPAGETWDSMSTCPYCEGIFMKITTHTAVNIGVPKASGNIVWGELCQSQ
ncbi:hypothetical protein [Candidatus Erwinia dacicola]|uniref:Uncharacterized protein n=1 Tax=Candidatus Erwinia dacicola TaxID=252393 RepID=A0A1E7Z1V8_9GAMM|nr:hypothetical protein [Candidatus Erwinia dacicola]OFC62605.1 hypothetical protein BBW68_08850 [Candidatus Erwinia dacicola]